MKCVLPLFFMTIGLSSIGCADKQKQIVPRPSDTFIFPSLIDTFCIKEEDLYWLENKNPSWMSYAQYHYNYLGKLTDSLYIEPRLYLCHEPPSILDGFKDEKSTTIKYKCPYENYVRDLEKSFSYPPPQIDIHVDVNHPIKGHYPVLLINTSSDTGCVGDSDDLPLIMEARNGLGIWLPVQEVLSGCGFGKKYIVLPPGECVLTLAPIYTGEYETLLRLRFLGTYSKPFRGSINPRQFERMFDRNGNYKEEYIRDMKTNRSNS